MKEWATDLLDAALFKTEAYERVAGRRNAFYLGFLTIVAIALISGIPALIGDLVAAGRPAALQMNTPALMADLQKTLEDFAPLLGTPPAAQREILSQIEQSIELSMDSARQIAAIPTPLPAPIGTILQAIGSYISRPFTDTGFPLSRVALSTWLGYGIWVMLGAKLLGGRAGLVSFFGATALYAGPFILTFFSFLPVVGPLLALVAFIWGWLIYIKSTKVSHGFGYGKGILVALLPLLIGAVVVALLVGGFGSFVALTSMGD